MKEADFYTFEDGKIRCILCPRYCLLKSGQVGFCYVRKNIDGKLYSLAYSSPYAVHVDPVEKKPLYHFLPGTKILSLGTAGCNMGCKFCQNWDISKARYDHRRAVNFTPEMAVQSAQANDCLSIAYTYNEPTIFAEYVIDIAELAVQKGIKNVTVTNGYITIDALKKVYSYIDAANVDLKSFSENFYRKLTLSHLKPVLDSLVEMRSMGVWIEITNLVIPTLNDDIGEVKQMVKWIIQNLGVDVPLHFTAFHPDFKILDRPSTPLQLLENLREEALQMGLHYVYLGNVFSREGSSTFCPDCKKLLIERSWQTVIHADLIANHCSCGQEIPGIISA